MNRTPVPAIKPTKVINRKPSGHGTFDIKQSFSDPIFQFLISRIFHFSNCAERSASLLRLFRIVHMLGLSGQ